MVKIGMVIVEAGDEMSVSGNLIGLLEAKEASLCFRGSTSPFFYFLK